MAATSSRGDILVPPLEPVAPWASGGYALLWAAARVACGAISGIFALYGSLVLANLILQGRRR